MTTPDALRAIETARRTFVGKAVVGVGSVINAEMCRNAIQAGASFVVSPICRKEIADAARAAGRPVMLGGYTPTEAQAAFEAGADFVKVFPADGLGPAYIKALKAPLPHLKIVPTGGVDLQTAGEFIKAGCSALGVGSSMMPSQAIAEKNWAVISDLAKQFISAVATARSSGK
jgi:2-dehydro-3-deoxyphosphogluconate aldolase/(4S)-4-hydroxy-2-oxoglutarate aldolase